jgi:hypothetical protein
MITSFRASRVKARGFLYEKTEDTESVTAQAALSSA